MFSFVFEKFVRQYLFSFVKITGCVPEIFRDARLSRAPYRPYSVESRADISKDQSPISLSSTVPSRKFKFEITIASIA